MNLIEGKEYCLNVEEELKQNIKGYIIRPSVAVIQIGDNEVSNLGIKQKEAACERVGIYFRFFKYEEDTPELTIINKIKELNNDDYVNGIMIELPIPEKYNEKRLLNSILNSKDIDGLTDINVGRLISGRKTLVPTAASAIITSLKENSIDLVGKEVVLVGKGKLIGKPLINLFLNEGATVTICHSKTSDLKKHTKEADILVSGTGVKNLITEDMVKEGAIVIDAGCTIEDGKVYGDVDFDSVSKKAALITAKTGGIGPITIAMFLKNIIMCYNSKK